MSGSNFWTPAKVEEARRRLLAGEEPKVIAKDIGCSRCALNAKAWRARWRVANEPERPIPHAMRKLAEFDPVVRRALEAREAA